MAFYGIVLASIMLCCLELVSTIAQNYSIQNSLAQSYALLSANIRLNYMGDIISNSKYAENIAEINGVNLSCNPICTVKTPGGYYVIDK